LGQKHRLSIKNNSDSHLLQYALIKELLAKTHSLQPIPQYVQLFVS